MLPPPLHLSLQWSFWFLHSSETTLINSNNPPVLHPGDSFGPFFLSLSTEFGRRLLLHSSSFPCYSICLLCFLVALFHRCPPSLPPLLFCPTRLPNGVFLCAPGLPNPVPRTLSWVIFYSPTVLNANFGLMAPQCYLYSAPWS